MDVTAAAPRTAAPTAAPTATSDASGGTGAGVISADFQTFLTMLTTQLKNQDPLNPLDSTDFAVQLATFSGVEQQVRTNDLLASLADRLATSGLGQYSTFIGMDARTSAPVLFDGSPITIEPEIAEGADRSRLIVRDESGQVVGQADLPPGTGPVEWVGQDATGAPLPAGRYALAVQNFAGDAPLLDTPVFAYALVTEVAAGPDGAVVRLASGAEVPATEVTGLRDPARGLGP